MEWVSAILALSTLAVVIGGFINRAGGAKGIGWQYIRFTVLTTAIPIVGLLALNGALSGEAATVISAAMAYAFGKSSENGS